MSQHVIVYEGVHGRPIVYSTAYTGTQVNTHIDNRVRRYGDDAKVRSMLADDLPPELAS